mmetsp:Transcript_24439/g.73344  ORF Transcript_24439/g.73344 Transcript_24439/m.73344 type:complete len:217 (+) Transcript_24439:1277-1927(+)
MPTTTTFSKRPPKAVLVSPLRTASAKARSRSRTSQDARMARSMATPSPTKLCWRPCCDVCVVSMFGCIVPSATRLASSRLARSAVCSTARRSDVLMRSPFFIWAILRGTSIARASRNNRSMVSSDTFWRVQSKNTPVSLDSSVMAPTRACDSRSLRRWCFSISRACFVRSRCSFVSEKPLAPSPPMRWVMSSKSVRPISCRCAKMPLRISSLWRSW